MISKTLGYYSLDNWARENAIFAESTDLSERAGEIMKTDFIHDLIKRMRNGEQ